jgi:hypothetical protein
LKQHISRVLLFTAASALISYLIVLFTRNDKVFIHFINNLFLISLIFIIIGGTLFIIQGGFFTAINYSFKRVYKRLSRKGVYMAELEGDNKNDDDFKRYRFSFMPSILLTGVILFALTMLLAFL